MVEVTDDESRAVSSSFLKVAEGDTEELLEPKTENEKKKMRRKENKKDDRKESKDLDREVWPIASYLNRYLRNTALGNPWDGIPTQVAGNRYGQYSLI